MLIEKRNIEFVPENERYGKVSRLFTLWFSANMQVLGLITGALAVSAGLNIFWAIFTISIGNLFGAIFMAGHSAQGPHLGIPQMIQSRAQYGVIGAALPLSVMVISYTLFTAADAVIMRSTIQQAIHISNDSAIVFFGIATLILAFIGYELIHKLAHIMSYASGGLFLIVVILAIKGGHIPSAALSWHSAGFSWTAFALVFTQSASWSIGFGPYVADYSRYLPVSVTTKSTFWYSYIGQALGATCIMSVGAILATIIPHIISSPGTGVASLFAGGAGIVLTIIILGVLQLNVLNVYSAYMSVVTIASGILGVNHVPWLIKLSVMSIIVFSASSIAISTQYNFDTYFADIIVAQLYFILPWTSINLTDYYFVRNGRYTLRDIYDRQGEYGVINVNTILISIATIIVSVPFMRLSFYTGPVAQWVGTDVTLFVSLFFPGIMYWWLNRGLTATSTHRSLTPRV